MAPVRRPPSTPGLEELVRRIYTAKIEESKLALVCVSPEDVSHEDRCAICLEPMRHELSRPPGCHHVFHSNCVKSWIARLRPPERIRSASYYELEHPEKSKRELACPVCGKSFIRGNGFGGRSKLADAEATVLLKSLFQGTWGRTLAEGLDEQRYATGGQVAPERELGREAFPALPGIARSRQIVDWRLAIVETRRDDSDRRARHKADAAVAAAVAAAARIAACTALGLSATPARLALIDEINRVGTGIIALERRRRALATWPAELLAWASSDPNAVARVEATFDAVLADPNSRASRALPPQKKSDRKLAHWLAEHYGLRSASYDKSPHRHIRVDKVPGCCSKKPDLLLSHASRYYDAPLPPPLLRRRYPVPPTTCAREGEARRENDTNATFTKRAEATKNATQEQEALYNEGCDSDSQEAVLQEAVTRSLEQCGYANSPIPDRVFMNDDSDVQLLHPDGQKSRRGDSEWCIVARGGRRDSRRLQKNSRSFRR